MNTLQVDGIDYLSDRVGNVENWLSDVELSLNTCGDFELIEEVTLSEDVQEFTTNANANKYKEMFLHIVIPTMNSDKASDFTKGRVFVYDQNGTTLFMETAVMYQDIGYNTYLTINAKLFGDTCITERTVASASSYAAYGNTGNGSTSNIPFGNVMTGGVKLSNNYLTKLRVLMYPLSERLFPAGTTYELWGVKA